MKKTGLIGGIIFWSMMLFGMLASAQQLSLPLQHGDDVLKAAYPGDANTRLISYQEIPAIAAKTFGEVDLSFEMGDGYYSSLASAYYEVNDGQQVVGYMEVVLMSYTEDPDIYLVAAMVNPQGVRITPEPEVINSYSDIEDEEILRLPAELQPQPED